MMTLLVNGATQELDYSDCANLAELVARAERASPDKEARVVVGVVIDGQVLSDNELNALESRPLDGITEISLKSRSARGLASSVLKQAEDYAGQVAAAIETVVEHFRMGRIEMANSLLANVTDSLMVLSGITNSVGDTLTESAERLSNVQNELLPWFGELVQAQEVNDPLHISDLLEYEIKPRIEQWGEVMHEILVELEGQGIPA